MENTFNIGKLTARDLSPVVDQVVKRTDKNRDGNISRSEFEEFLGEVLNKLSAGDQAKPTSHKTEGPAPIGRR